MAMSIKPGRRLCYAVSRRLRTIQQDESMQVIAMSDWSSENHEITELTGLILLSLELVGAH